MLEIYSLTKGKEKYVKMPRKITGIATIKFFSLNVLLVNNKIRKKIMYHLLVHLIQCTLSLVVAAQK